MILLRSAPRSSAVVATAEITTFAGVAHAFAGGALPPIAPMAAFAALVMTASLVVLRGRVLIRTAVPLVAIVQVGLHVGFELTTPAAAGHAVHLGHSGPASFAAELHLTSAMLAAHLATAVVAALVLVYQDRAVDIVRQWLATSSPTLVDVALKRSPIVIGDTALTRWVFLRQAPGRGPPEAYTATP